MRTGHVLRAFALLRPDASGLNLPFHHSISNHPGPNKLFWSNILFSRMGHTGLDSIRLAAVDSATVNMNGRSVGSHLMRSDGFVMVYGHVGCRW